MPGPDEYADFLARLHIADELGVDSAWLEESWGRDVFVGLGRLAGETKRIRLGPGIANVYSRSAAVLAMAMATLDEMTGGRTMLGIGSSGQLVIELLHGVAFDRPLQRIREYTEIFNAIVSGEKLNYEGEIFKLSRGFKLLFKPARTHIPVYIAAITPKSIIQAGEVADGWMPIFWPKERFADARRLLEEGAARAGRDPASIEIAPSLRVTVIQKGEDREEVRREARRHVAFYVTRMGVFYQQMLARNGYEGEVAAIREAFAAKDERAMLDAVTDEMLDSVAIVGALEECAGKLDEWRALGVDLPIIALPDGDAAQVERLLSALMR